MVKKILSLVHKWVTSVLYLALGRQHINEPIIHFSANCLPHQKNTNLVLEWGKYELKFAAIRFPHTGLMGGIVVQSTTGEGSSFNMLGSLLAVASAIVGLLSWGKLRGICEELVHWVTASSWSVFFISGISCFLPFTLAPFTFTPLGFLSFSISWKRCYIKTHRHFDRKCC